MPFFREKSRSGEVLFRRFVYVLPNSHPDGSQLYCDLLCCPGEFSVFEYSDHYLETLNFVLEFHPTECKLEDMIEGRYVIYVEVRGEIADPLGCGCSEVDVSKGIDEHTEITFFSECH